MGEIDIPRGVSRLDSVFDIGDQRQLFVDDQLVTRLDGVRFRMHDPLPGEKVFEFDRPWEGEVSWCPVIFRDGDRLRMWYRAETVEENAHLFTGYAESRDGIHWDRPSLGLADFRGSKENNITIHDPNMKNVAVFWDEKPGVPDTERYKAVGRWTGDSPGWKKGIPSRIFGLVSSDGIHWEKAKGGEVLTAATEKDPMFDSPLNSFWDPWQDRYRIYVRGWRPPGWEKMGRGIRAIRTTTSRDFLKWEPWEFIDIGENPWLEHLYTNSCHPYYRGPFYLMFPKRFHPERQFDSEWESSGQSDVVFMASRDGKRFCRLFRDAYLRPGPDPLNWHERSIYIAPYVMPSSPGEMVFYSVQNYHTDRIHLKRFTLREDGFTSLHAHWEGGEAVTRPLSVSGNSLEINCSTSGVGFVKIELQDESGKPLPGFTLDDCDEIFGDEIARRVGWRGQTGLRKTVEYPLRLRIVMKDADLYSFRFHSNSG